jgi:hypothetical protein
VRDLPLRAKAAPPRHKFSGRVNEEDEFEDDWG